MIDTRPSARGIVLNDAGEVLLLRCEDPAPLDPRNPAVLRYWATPGGGTQAGETAEESLARELYEETGLRNVEIGPCVWTRELEFILPQGLTLCHERYFLCSSRQTEVSFAHLTADEINIVRETKWWPPDLIAQSDETFRPGEFPALLRRLITEGPPQKPIRIES